MAETTQTVITRDGGSMPVFAVWPESGHGPGLVLLQEIFGVTEYIRRRARDLAELGYIVFVPHLYWRLGPDVQLPENTPEGLQQAFGYMQRLDEPQAVSDAADTLASLRALPQTSARVGVFGFCLGGRLAYRVGAAADPDLVVSYYGSGIGNLLDSAADLSAPVMFHFGDADQFLPVEEAQRIGAAFAGRAGVEVFTHVGAGHAFDNPSPMFHHHAASEEAWPQTVAFLERNLPVEG